MSGSRPVSVRFNGGGCDGADSQRRAGADHQGHRGRGLAAPVIRLRLVVRDAECRGLALVVNPSAMSWVFSYKPRGLDSLTGKRFPSKSMTIGGPASHSPEAARAEANRFRDRVKAGADPAAERRVKQAKEATARGATVARLVEAYSADFPKRPKMRGTGLPSKRYVVEELANLRAAVAAMKAGTKPAAEVSGADLRALLRVSAAGSTLARQRFGAVSRFLDWCLDEGHVTANVCASIGKKHRPKPPGRPQPLPRPRTGGELVDGGGRHGGGRSPRLRPLLLVIPCRRNEAARMDWAHVSLDGGAWAQPDKLTKNGEPHRFHLRRWRWTCCAPGMTRPASPQRGWCFPAPRSGKGADDLLRDEAGAGSAGGADGLGLARLAPDLCHHAGRGWRFGSGGGCGAEPSEGRHPQRCAGGVSAGGADAGAESGNGSLVQHPERCH
jgi:integrase